MVSIFSTVRDIERLRQIVVVLGRHGFGEIVQRTGLGRFSRKPETSDIPEVDEAGRPTSAVGVRVSLGSRLKLVLQDLGPSFVKLGQIMSTRSDLLPADIISELKLLQDNVSPLNFDDLREQLEADLGDEFKNVFETFDEKPLASASMAQVHRATLKVNEDEPAVNVVVKIQRPKIKKTIERDIELLYILARAIDRNIPESRIYSPVGLVSEFDRAITAELDFSREGDNANRFRNNFAGNPKCRVPQIYPQASGKRVLTMEYLDGFKTTEALAQGWNGEAIAKVTLNVLFKQIFEDGFFHADPHPGNLFILGSSEAPVIGLIDLGLVGRLSPQLRDKTIDLMVAAVRQDSKGVADALYNIGTPTKRIDRDRYDAEVTMLAEKYLGRPLREIEMSLLIHDIVTGAMKYGLEIPPDFLMLARSLMTVEGVGKELHPDLDVFSEVKPYFLRLIKERYSPDRLGADAVKFVSRLTGTAGDLPRKFDEILDDMRRGDLAFRVNDPEIPRATDLLGRRLFSGMTVSALIASGSILIASGQASILGYLMLGLSMFWTFWTMVRGWSAHRDFKRRQDR